MITCSWWCCCWKSSSTNNIPLRTVTNPLYKLTAGSSEEKLWEQILDGIPSHYRQTIENLPPHPFLNAYGPHLLAIQYIEAEEFSIAGRYEIQAVADLKKLLPNHEDHILFADMNAVLSLCLFKNNQIPEAIEYCKTALTILLLRNPKDYAELIKLYSHLAQCYKGVQSWKDTIECLTVLIETIQLSSTPDEEYVRKTEANIELIKKRINVEALLAQPNPDPDESQIDFQRRKIAVMDAFNAECGFFPYDIEETKRNPDTQTESQVNENILEEILSHLIKYLNEYVLLQFKAGCVKAIFLAAAFKNGRMNTSPLSPAIIEAALTIIIRQMNEYSSLMELPLLLSYTDDSNTFPKGVREFRVSAKEGINLNKNNKPSYETRDCFA